MLRLSIDTYVVWRAEIKGGKGGKGGGREKEKRRASYSIDGGISTTGRGISTTTRKCLEIFFR
jgi:hypothetical protein